MGSHAVMLLNVENNVITDWGNHVVMLFEKVSCEKML